MATITDRGIAGDRVAQATAASSWPAVTDGEIQGTAGEDYADGLFAQAMLCQVWEESTAYLSGTVVIPSEDNENGRCFRCIQPGASGATEPTWPIGQMGIAGRTINGFGVLVADGDAIWEEAGPAPEALWDLALVEHLIWKRKQSLSVTLYDVGLDAKDQLKRSQVFEQIERMVERTTPFVVAQ